MSHRCINKQILGGQISALSS